MSSHEVLRAVRSLPLSKLKLIMSRHYGAREVDAMLNTCRLSIPNLSLYLELTEKHGKNETAVKEILECCKGEGESTGSCERKCVSNLGRECAEDFLPRSSDYLNGMECNKTLSCCLEAGTFDLYPEEEEKDEEGQGYDDHEEDSYDYDRNTPKGYSAAKPSPQDRDHGQAEETCLTRDNWYPLVGGVGDRSVSRNKIEGVDGHGVQTISSVQHDYGEDDSEGDSDEGNEEDENEYERYEDDQDGEDYQDQVEGVEGYEYEEETEEDEDEK